MDEVIKLEMLAMEVSDCRLCEAHGMALNHLPAIHRGDCARMIVIGAQPEKADINSRQLFSGLAGKRMLKWLVRAGVGVCVFSGFFGEIRGDLFRFRRYDSISNLVVCELAGLVDRGADSVLSPKPRICDARVL